MAAAAILKNRKIAIAQQRGKMIASVIIDYIIFI